MEFKTEQGIIPLGSNVRWRYRGINEITGQDFTWKRGILVDGEEEGSVILIAPNEVHTASLDEIEIERCDI